MHREKNEMKPKYLLSTILYGFSTLGVMSSFQQNIEHFERETLTKCISTFKLPCVIGSDLKLLENFISFKCFNLELNERGFENVFIAEKILHI